jgi:hypothetical protein
MRVVDTCPIRKLRKVLGALQEGLSVWAANQYRVLTMEENMFDVSGCFFFFLSSPPPCVFVSDLFMSLGRLGRPIVPDNFGVLAVSRLVDRRS